MTAKEKYVKDFESVLYGAKVRVDKDGTAALEVKEYPVHIETGMMGNGETGNLYFVRGVTSFDAINMKARGIFFAETKAKAKKRLRDHLKVRVKEAEEELKFSRMLLGTVV